MKCLDIQLFENRPEVILKTYILDNSKELLNGKSRPAIIINPGGAYLNLSDREAEPIAIAFANMGYHAFVLKYSIGINSDMCIDIFDFLQRPELHTELNPLANYPNPIIEIGKAFTVIHENKETWFVDVDKIALCGFSAGGHNVAMYSNLWHSDMISDALNCSREILKPAAAILSYPMIDYRIMYNDQTFDIPILAEIFKHSSKSYLGVEEPTLEQMEMVSPNLNVNEYTPPMFIWATSEDLMVPVENAARMAVALASESIPFEFHVFESGEHGLSKATQATAENIKQIDRDASKWMDLAESWLMKRLSLDLPEALY